MSSIVTSQARHFPCFHGINVSGIVTSQARHFPCFHGINVTPSVRFPSVLSKPVGSFDAGILARLVPRQIISLTALCLVTRPALLLHDKPCVPLNSTVLPQGHSCASQTLVPSLSRGNSDCFVCHSETHCGNIIIDDELSPLFDWLG